jgi:hypothetical protein
MDQRVTGKNDYVRSAKDWEGWRRGNSRRSSDVTHSAHSRRYEGGRVGEYRCGQVEVRRVLGDSRHSGEYSGPNDEKPVSSRGRHLTIV